MPPRLSALHGAGFRLALFFFALCIVIGVHMPYWPLWLQSRGFDAADVGTLLFALAVGRTVAAPLVGLAADRLDAHRRILLVVCVLVVPLAALFFLASGFVAQLALHVGLGLLLSSIVPLTDHLTLLAERRGKLDYARTRAWGSKGFIVGSLLCGALISGRDPAWILPILLVALLLQAGAAWTLPDLAEPARDASAQRPTARTALMALARNRAFVLTILASGFIQASHAVLYAFATLHWRAIGHNASIIGALWTEGVIAEIVLFYFAARVLRHASPVRLMQIGAVAGLVRWPALAGAESLALLVALQGLHALTFGATHLGAMRLLRETVPAELSATAQTLHSALVGGVFLGGGLWIAGHAWGGMGSAAFWLMVLPSAAGLGVAALLARQLAQRARGLAPGAVSPRL